MNSNSEKSYGSSCPEVIRGIYDEKANTYDESRLRTPYQIRFDETERKILRRHLGGSISALEVGAGTGRLTNELLALSKHVTVVDISPGMLDKLRQKFPACTRLKLQIHDVYELDKLEGYGQFDALLSMRMLPHISDITKVLTILRDSVRPGGLLMTDFWNRQSYVYWKKRGSSVYNNYVSYNEALAILADAGLKLIAVEGAGFGSPFNLNLEFLSRTPLKRVAYSLIAICRRPVR